jgi:serine protease inhibitor
MKKSLIGPAFIMIAGISGIMASCDKTKDNTLPGDPVPIELTLKQKGVVEAANEFAFDFFVPIVTEQKGAENIMISLQCHQRTLNDAERCCWRDL